MRIHTLQLENFRGFENADFRLNNEFTVLIGDNAKGKTSVLDALSMMLYAYLYDFADHPPRHIKRNDARLRIFAKGDSITSEPQYPVIVGCTGTHHGDTLSWSKELFEKGRTTTANTKDIANMGKKDFKQIQNGEDVNLPVLGYYGTGRLWQLKRDADLPKPESRTAGYVHCLEPASNHNLLLKWFRKQELAAIQEGKQFGVLEAVRNAVKQCVPGCKHFFYEIKSSRLMMDTDREQRIPFDSLSDGYRNMVAMVADIAHRAGRLNPHLRENAVRETSGIVLIDEIDLHLHPKWQRQVVNDLRRTFPKIQFIATTHSPFIIQSMKPGEVIDMDSKKIATTHSPFIIQSMKPGEVIDMDSHASPPPSSPYSNMSIEDIVEDVMGVPVPQRGGKHLEMVEVAKEYYSLLKQSEGASLEKIEELKIKLDEISSRFSDEPAYHAFLEMERIAAGLGRKSERSHEGKDNPDETCR